MCRHRLRVLQCTAGFEIGRDARGAEGVAADPNARAEIGSAPSKTSLPTCPRARPFMPGSSSARALLETVAASKPAGSSMMAM